MAESSARSVTVTILNRRGLHARAASKFVALAGDFAAEICVVRGETSVAATSIMGLMMLAAGKGDALTITAQGADADKALAALTALINDKFEEDE